MTQELKASPPSQVSCRTFVQAECAVRQSAMAFTQQPLLRLDIAMLILATLVLVCPDCEVEKKNGLAAAHSVLLCAPMHSFSALMLDDFPPLLRAMELLFVD
jgi:hypothetical protein